jgi:hypothetical protein
MTKIKLFGALAAVLGVFLAAWLVKGWKDGRDLAEMTARAEKAEKIVADLTLANSNLEAAVQGCNKAATVQAAASVAAMARREELSEIMTCPGPAAASGEKPKGEPLNDAQDIKMVSFYNNLFAGLGVRSQ